MTMLYSSALLLFFIIIGTFRSGGTMMIRALGVVRPVSKRESQCGGTTKALPALLIGGRQQGRARMVDDRWMTTWTTSSKSTSRQSAAAAPSSNNYANNANAMTNLPALPPNCHRIVLMRHGESEFNNANVFTGWCDIALTPRGVVEAIEAGQVFASQKIYFRKCYSSVLTRSIVTAQRALEAAGVAHTPLQYDWRLNERHYGSLQGLSKERTAERLGRKRVMEWRRSYYARPPLMTEHHPHYQIIYGDPRYRKLLLSDQSIQLPLGESLEDCQRRVIDAWNDIVAEITSLGDSINGGDDNGYTLIVAHANSLRALVMHLDDIPTDKIEDVNIPTAIPFFYDICVRTGRTEMSNNHEPSAGSFRGVYISDDRKKRSFLERRRAANDPLLWALDDHQVTKSMLLNGSNDDEDMEDEAVDMEGHEEEAKRNTELYSSIMEKNS
jgi:2,3-bisphosphoglycerate-dependent phosphoglycerate mutase